METILDLIKNLPEIVEITLVGLGGLTLLATAIVRIIPGKADDEFVGMARGLLLKAMRMLPTLGVNPNTKGLEKALEERK